MDKNQSIAKKVWHDYLQCSTKPFSWGLEFKSVTAIENGTTFHLNGKVCGWIKIQQTNNNRYDITITPDNSTENEIVYYHVSCEEKFGLTQKVAV
jgi:hypothetical protein